MRSVPPTLEQFEELTCQALNADLARLGFDGPLVTKTPPEVVLVYSRADCRISAFYEHSDPPWIKIEFRGQNGRWRGRSLDKIVSTDCPELAAVRPAAKNVTRESVQQLLSEYALALLKICGTTSS